MTGRVSGTDGTGQFQFSSFQCDKSSYLVKHTIIFHRQVTITGITYFHFLLVFISDSFLKNILFIYFQKDKERERNINVWVPPTYPALGAWPTAQTCALTRNRTSNPLVCRLALNPLRHTSQGSFFCSIRMATGLSVLLKF